MKASYLIAALLICITPLIHLTRHQVPPYFAGSLISIPIVASPIEKAFYYDWPEAYVLIDHLTARYGPSIWDHPEEIPPGYLNEVKTTPIWQGFLPEWLGYHFPKALWFEKISQGEVWRTFTPALLHTELFHLIFNLFWLIALGRLIEEQTGIAKYLVLTLLFGIFSNTAQYLMTGLHFLGYSGVISGLFGYAYVDQKEGTPYPLPSSLFAAVFIFIFGSVFLEALSLFSPFKISFGIANTAHVAGLLSGFILGKISPTKKITRWAA